MPFIGNIGPLELLLVLTLALIILGPGKLPEVGAALGRTIREFRKASTDVEGTPEAVASTPATPAQPSSAPGQPPATAARSAETPAPATEASESQTARS